MKKILFVVFPILFLFSSTAFTNLKKGAKRKPTMEASSRAAFYENRPGFQDAFQLLEQELQKISRTTGLSTLASRQHLQHYNALLDFYRPQWLREKDLYTNGKCEVRRIEINKARAIVHPLNGYHFSQNTRLIHTCHYALKDSDGRSSDFITSRVTLTLEVFQKSECQVFATCAGDNIIIEIRKVAGEFHLANPVPVAGGMSTSGGYVEETMMTGPKID